MSGSALLIAKNGKLWRLRTCRVGLWFGGGGVVATFGGMAAVGDDAAVGGVWDVVVETVISREGVGSGVYFGDGEYFGD